jgi:hypothetical protein
MLGVAGLGHPLGNGPGARALEFRPPEQVVRDDKPDVTKSRRGLFDLRSRGMKIWVMTWVDVTLRE